MFLQTGRAYGAENAAGFVTRDPLGLELSNELGKIWPHSHLIQLRRERSVCSNHLFVQILLLR